jgi:hypothetical protein
MSEQTKPKLTTDQISDHMVDTTTVHENCIIHEHKTRPKEYKYAVLMETSGEECESWYYCIRYEGNESNLKHLYEQLESVDWYILDDLSTFDLDLEHFVSEQTAKELTKLELNHHSFHRKFDGVLDKVNLNLRKKDKNEKKMVKVFEVLGYGQVEDYVDGEDLDEEDLTDTQSSSDEEKESDSDSGDESKKEETPKKGIPMSLQKSNLPRFARAKRRQRKGKKE